MPETVMFTIATAGFVPFVRNLQASLERLGMERHLTVYALDDEAFDELSADGLACLRYEAEGLAAWSNFKTPEYGRTMCLKYAIGLEILATGRNALYVDSDIVFLRNPMLHLHGIVASTEADLVMQWEAPTNVFNAGFWLARPTKATVRLFEQALEELRTQELTEDQAYVNRTLSETQSVNVVKLDPDLFACANRFDVSVHFAWRGNLSPLFFDFGAAYLLHCNYLVGKDAKVRSLVRNDAVFWPGLLADHKTGTRGAGLVMAETIQRGLRRWRGTLARAPHPRHQQ